MVKNRAKLLSMTPALGSSPRRWAARAVGGAAICFGAVLTATSPQMASAWRDRDIRIDGVNSEWARLDELDKGPAVAVANDEQNLYVIVSTSDQQMRRQFAGGVILWFDSTGGKKETFAIGIPGATSADSVSHGAPGATAETAVPSSTLPIDQFDVYGPGKRERHLVRLDSSLGIEMAVSTTQGTLAYELKLPLEKDEVRLYAVGAHPGATVGFAVATPETPVQPNGRGGGFGGRGRQTLSGSNTHVFLQGRGGSGGMGGRGGGMRGGSGGTRESMEGPAPFKMWTVLHLASAPPQ